MADATGLEPGFQAAINALIAASGGKLYIVSGYRSDQEQQQLWNNAVAKYGSPEAARKWVAPPGHSNHNRGMAVDLGGDIQLAHQLAAQFGLVFPMSWEPWHIEPVGARENSSQQAYTQGPPGTTNPVVDPALGSSPDFLAASLANGMAAALDPTMVGPLAGGTVAAGTTEGAGGGTGNSTSGTYSKASGKGGNVSPQQVYAALRAQGLDPAAAAALTSIAGRESGFNTGAYNGNRATGDDSHGLFQINLLNGGWAPFLRDHGIDPNSLNTLEGSTAAAAAIYKNSGLQPWGPYKGQSALYNTNPQVGVDASGGEATLDQVMGL